MPAFFPLWVVITHFLNIFFLLLLARSGLEVLSAFPKLYWHDDCPPGREWARFSRTTYGADSRTMWSSLDEEEAWSPVVALPGRKNLGLGRHWHFMTVQFWILTGVVYVALVFATGYWHYLVPTRWAIIPDSVRAVGTYLHFQIPARIPGEPFEPAQKLAYFLVIFVLAPFQIATGAAMSPSVLARFPWYGKLFGGKQGARSLHSRVGTRPSRSRWGRPGWSRSCWSTSSSAGSRCATGAARSGCSAGRSTRSSRCCRGRSRLGSGSAGPTSRPTTG